MGLGCTRDSEQVMSMEWLPALGHEAGQGWVTKVFLLKTQADFSCSTTGIDNAPLGRVSVGNC